MNFVDNFVGCRRNFAGMGEKRNAIGFWLKTQKERDHQKEQGLDVWTIFKWMLER
jgi:hypothetical protein